MTGFLVDKGVKAAMSNAFLSLDGVLKKTKWIALGVILVVCMLGISTCRQVKVKEAFEANIKNHQESSYGSLAAFDGSQNLYYYANYEGISGIYKININSSETELVIPCDDIKKIQIKNEKLYYLEYETDIHDHYIRTKGYQLMEYDLIQKKTEKITLYKRRTGHYGTWDFYIGDKGILFTDLILFPARKTTHDATGIKGWDGEYFKSMRQIGKQNIIMATDLTLYLYAFNDLYCISTVDWGTDESAYVADWGEVGVYDNKQDESVLGNSLTAKIIGQGRNLVLTYKGQMILYDAEEHKILKEYLFENTDCLNNLKIYGNTFIVFGKNENNNDQILYVDNQTGTIDKLFEAPENEYVLYFDRESYVLFDQGKITNCKYSGEEIWSVNLGKIRNTDGYKTDTAGNWLFVTHWNKWEKVRELDARINIMTGEVAED